VTALENQLYLALLGARTIVAATANVNPQAFRILRLMDQAAAAYKALEPDPATPEALTDGA
jgi:dihydrodipicolinate synthase/N-acetylneuraminate lyase